jgi:hypothetical protein
VLARRHSAGHYEQDRPAGCAPVAPAQEDARGRCRIGRRRPAELALPDAVTVEAKPASGLATGHAAGARGWARGLDRRRRGQPGLDVERVMNDS